MVDSFICSIIEVIIKYVYITTKKSEKCIVLTTTNDE